MRHFTLSKALTWLSLAITASTNAADHIDGPADLLGGDCHDNRLQTSLIFVKTILDNIHETYDLDGGEITGIDLIATNIYVASIAQEERIDQLSYELTLEPDCSVTLARKRSSTKSPRRGGQGMSSTYNYGEIVPFEENQELRFPDFTLTYLRTEDPEEGQELRTTRSIQHRVFRIIDNNNVAQEVTITHGQLPPEPKQVVIGGFRFTIFTFKTRASDERLYPNKLVIEQD